MKTMCEWVWWSWLFVSKVHLWLRWTRRDWPPWAGHVWKDTRTLCSFWQRKVRSSTTRTRTDGRRWTSPPSTVTPRLWVEMACCDRAHHRTQSSLHWALMWEHPGAIIEHIPLSISSWRSKHCERLNWRFARLVGPVFGGERSSDRACGLQWDEASGPGHRLSEHVGGGHSAEERSQAR